MRADRCHIKRLGRCCNGKFEQAGVRSKCVITNTTIIKIYCNNSIQFCVINIVVNQTINSSDCHNDIGIVLEAIITKRCNSIGQGNIHQVGSIRKRIISYSVDIICNNNMMHILSVQNIIAKNTLVVIKMNSNFGINMVIRFSAIECVSSYTLNTIRNVYLNKAITSCESIVSDTFNRVRQGKLIIHSIVIEGIITNRFKRIREGNFRQFVAKSKHIIADFRNTILHNHLINVGIIEHIICNFSAVVANGNR